MAEPGRKLKFALYWCASCGGCDVAVLDTNEKILQIAEAADILLWPVAMDFKYDDVRGLADGEIDVCMINGAVRNSEQREICELLRRKSKVVVAFGSCACTGGIPGLANLCDGREAVFRRAYSETPTTNNPADARPLTRVAVPEGELELPAFYNAVYKLDDIIPVEYYLPGCPPPPDLIWAAVETIVGGNLPPPPANLAPDRALCDTCPRDKGEKKVGEFTRVHLTEVDPDRCFLEQGILCCGPATRSGCGERCIRANMPCRGCFGPTSGVRDDGARLAGGIAAMADSNDADEIREILSGIRDPAGTFYRFSVPASLLALRRTAGEGHGSGPGGGGSGGKGAAS